MHRFVLCWGRKLPKRFVCSNFFSAFVRERAFVLNMANIDEATAGDACLESARDRMIAAGW